MMSAFGLLATYAEDAYVELTGTQAINTGYKAFYNSTTKDQSQVVLDFQLTEVPANGTRIIGGDGGSKGVSYFSLFADGNFKYAYNGKETGTSTGKPVTTDRYTVQLPAYGNAVLSLNGSQLATSWVGMANGTMPNPIVLGANALDAAGTSFSDQVAKMKIYGFKILEKKDGAWTSKYDFKPVVKGGVACLYDEATGMTLQDDRGRALAFGGDIETLPEDGYVQSNGSSIQGINSRFFWQPGARVDVDYALTDPAKNTQYRIVGADWGGVVQRASVYIGGGGVSFGMGVDDVDNFKGDGSSIDPDTRRHTVVIDAKNSKYYYKSGNTTLWSKTPTGKCTKTAIYPMGLMAGTTNQNGSVFRHFAKMKLYRAKFWLNGELKHDYVPCVKGDVAGLKDLVDGQFVTSGALTYGGNILKEDDDPYLENTDAANNVNTGYKPTAKTKIVADFAFRVATPLQYLYNASDNTAGGIATKVQIHDNGSYAYQCCVGTDYKKYVSSGVPARAYVRQQVTVDPVENKVVFENAGYTNWAVNGWIYLPAANASQYNMRLFSSGDGKTNVADVRLYGFKIYEDGELVRDYVPAVIDGVAGLYDKANDSFVSGSIKTALKVYGATAYDGGAGEDAYLLSDGNQLINSGYFMNPKTRLEVVFALVSATDADKQTRLFGQDYSTTESPLTFFTALYQNGGSPSQFAFAAGDTFSGKASGYNPDLKRHRAVLNCAGPTWALRTYEGTTEKSGKLVENNTPKITQTANRALGFFGTATNDVFTGWRHLIKAKIYSVEIGDYDAATKTTRVTHKYYPAKIDGKVGLYDIYGEEFHGNVTGSATDFVLGGAGYDGSGKDSGFMLKPAAAVEIAYGETETLTAFAPGAIEHRWTRNGEPIDVAGLSLTVDWKRGRTADVYVVTPVYNVNGVIVEGTPATTTVTYKPSGLSIIVR